MKKFLSVMMAAAFTLSVCTLTACNDNKNQNSDVSHTETASQASQATEESSKEEVTDISVAEEKTFTAQDHAKLESMLSPYKNVPSFKTKSEVIDAGEIAKDKTVTLIPKNSANSFYSLASEQFRNAAETAGFAKVIVAETDGSPASYNNAIATAIENSDLIVLLGDINKDFISANIELAQANGIKVISAGNVGVDENDHYVDYTVPIDYQLSGKLMAYWAIWKNNGKVNALVINNSESTLSTSVYKGFAEEFEKYIGNGYCTVLSGENIEIGNGLATKIKEAIKKDPNINYVVVLDENMINDAVSGVEQSGKNIKITAAGGMTESFEIAQNEKIDMLVAQSYEWIGYSTVDYALRVLGKKTLPQNQDVPVRTVYADIIKKAMDENTYNNIEGFYEICFGSEFITGYSEKWSL